MKRSELKLLIKEHIKLLVEGERVTNNLYLGEYKDFIIISLKSNNGEEDNLSTQRIQVSYEELPKLLDSIFNRVPVEIFPAEYRRSMVSKLIDGMADDKSKFSDEEESNSEESSSEEKMAADNTPDNIELSPEEEAALDSEDTEDLPEPTNEPEIAPEEDETPKSPTK